MPLREVWQMEEHHLTPWLAENLDLLEVELGIGLELVEREHRVGNYELDLLLKSSDGRTVIVENQFGSSNHGHFGQVLTYAGGTEADVVVWLAEGFRDEHLAALQWLNNSTAEGIAFFAVTLAAVRIGDSLPAPILEAVCRPNEWMKQTVRERKDAQRQSQFDMDWDAYSTETEHGAEKMRIVQALAEGIERATGWKPSRTKNQINFRSEGRKAVGIQFWAQKPRIIAYNLTVRPDTDPFPNAASSGPRQDGWCWEFQSMSEIPDDFMPLIEALSAV